MGSIFSLLICDSNSSFSLAAISSLGATHNTLPFLRIARPLLRMMMSSTWSQGTFCTRKVRAPVTESEATTLKLVKSAITWSTWRTSMFWKFSDSFSPVKASFCEVFFGSWFSGRISSTNSVSVW